MNISIERRTNDDRHCGVHGRYDIVIIHDDGSRTSLSFRDRAAKLLYTFTLMHPQGFQRRMIARNNYKEILELCAKLFGTGACQRVENMLTHDFNHYVSQAAAQPRKAVEKSLQDPALASSCALADPRKTGGKVFIPIVKDNKASVSGDLSTAHSANIYSL